MTGPWQRACCPSLLTGHFKAYSHETLPVSGPLLWPVLHGWGIEIEGFVCLMHCAFPRQAPGKYTIMVDDEKGGPDMLAVKSGDMVEVVQEGDEGLW